jgi:hypothetical protein
MGRQEWIANPTTLRISATTPCLNVSNGRSGLQLLAADFGWDEGVVDQNSAMWNQVANWLRQVDQLQQAA